MNKYNLSYEEAWKRIDEQAKIDTSFGGAIAGGMSEVAFKEECSQQSWIKSCEKITDKKKKGDFNITTIEGKSYSIEIKECNTDSIYKENDIFYGRVGTNRSDKAETLLSNGQTVYCNYFLTGQYNILAISKVNMIQKYDFCYILESNLDRVSKSKKIPKECYNDFLNPTQKINFSDSKVKNTLKEVIDF